MNTATTANIQNNNPTAFYHLPGLFEFYELYRIFLPLFRKHREYFYDWCEIGSIYGAPSDCIWGGGRTSFGYSDPEDVLDLVREYGISARLTFSNSLLREEHLTDKKCNELCKMFEHASDADNSPHTHQLQNGVIVHSELLLNYLQKNYPDLYLISSTTKVLTDFQDFLTEINREDFRYIVPDFRLNKVFDKLDLMSQHQKDKVEFLCNECCWFGCRTERLVMNPSAGRISEILPRSFTVLRRMAVTVTAFPRQWKIPDSSVWMIYRIFTCQWDFLILRLKDAGLEVR